MRLKELAATRVHYGYRRLHILLRREGWKVNAKRIYRLYREEQLSLRLRTPRRRVACRRRVDRPNVTCINDCWAMDFMYDELFDGRRIRLLTIVDHFTRECLAIVVGQRFPSGDVVKALDHLGASRSLPKTIRVDNGTEFTSKAMDRWAYENGVTLDFSRPGKPTDNALIESFNGSVRAELDCPRKLVHGYEDRVWFNKSGWLFRFNVGSVATGVEAEQVAANSAGVSPLSEPCGRRWL